MWYITDILEQWLWMCLSRGTMVAWHIHNYRTDNIKILCRLFLRDITSMLNTINHNGGLWTESSVISTRSGFYSSIREWVSSLESYCLYGAQSAPQNTCSWRDFFSAAGFLSPVERCSLIFGDGHALLVYQHQWNSWKDITNYGTEA